MGATPKTDAKNSKVVTIKAPSAKLRTLPQGERLPGSWAHLRHELSSMVAVTWPWKWQAVSAACAVGLAIYFGPTLILGPRIVGDAVTRGEFVHTVVASGHVEAPFRVSVGSQITGVVASVPVVEGQNMKAGETLVTLDDGEVRAAVVQAEGAVAQAEARMRQLRELTLPSAEQTLSQAQSTVLNAQKAYDRAAQLAKSGYTTAVVVDDTTKALDLAKSQVRNAEYQVYTSRAGGSDYVMADTQLNQATASLTSAQSRLSYTVIKAPKNGILISRNVEVGNVVQPSVVLMTLSPSGETQLVVQIDEKNLGLIAVGQKALGSADAYATKTFPAEVIYVNPGIDIQRASVEVKLKVPNPPPYIRQDMTVSVDIEVARRPNAAIISSGSVRGLASGHPWLLIVKDGHATKVPVAVGIVSGGKAEIISGADENQIAIPSSNTVIRAGQRVRASAVSGTAQ